MRDEARADRIELVSGRGETEVWKDSNSLALAPMFKTFRREFVAQLNTRFQLNTTPNKHVLLALKMNPSINTDTDSPLLKDKSAMEEMMIGEYKRALRRQCVLIKNNAIAAKQAEAGSAATSNTEPAPAPAPASASAPATAPPSAPVPKRRKGLLGSVIAQQTCAMPSVEASDIDAVVKAEIDRFKVISQNIIATGSDHQYFQGKARLNLRAFWMDHKKELPLHFAVYVSEVGCKKSAAANVESVFSGAGKFTEEAGSAGHKLISRIVRLHYNWKYPFLRPTTQQVCNRYMAKFQDFPPTQEDTERVIESSKAEAVEISEAASIEVSPAEAVEAETSA